MCNANSNQENKIGGGRRQQLEIGCNLEIGKIAQKINKVCNQGSMGVNACINIGLRDAL